MDLDAKELWSAIRFPMLSDTFLTNMVRRSHHWPQILTMVDHFDGDDCSSVITSCDTDVMGRTTDVVDGSSCKSLAGAAASSWTRSFRSRSRVNDMIATHCDGSQYLEFFNTEDQDKWRPLIKLPEGAVQ